MQVTAIRNKFEGSPAEISAFGSAQSATDISIGKSYEVYALSVFQGVVFLQILSDANIIAWLPGWFFEVHDPSLPMVIGPEFVS
jgi:hypothetical protein